MFQQPVGGPGYKFKPELVTRGGKWTPELVTVKGGKEGMTVSGTAHPSKQALKPEGEITVRARTPGDVVIEGLPAGAGGRLALQRICQKLTALGYEGPAVINEEEGTATLSPSRKPIKDIGEIGRSVRETLKGAFGDKALLMTGEAKGKGKEPERRLFVFSFK